MRIIHLTSSGGWGGREMYPATLAELQRGRGHETLLAAKRDTPLASHLAGGELDHRLIRVGPYIDPLAAWSLAKILRETAPDIIHIHLSRDLALVVAACALARVRPGLVLHKHIASAGNKRDPLHRYLYSRLCAVIAISNFVRRSLLASCPLGEEKVEVIFYGIDSRRFENISRASSDQTRTAVRAGLGASQAGTLLAGVVGRLEPRKGQEEFLEAASRMLERRPELRFAMIGAPEGDYDEHLKRRAEQLGLGGRLVFSGFRSDALSVYSALDILVVPSREEAFGLVAAEGMLAGLPVVAADAGALPEFVSHGRTGMLYPAGDAAALADVLGALSSNPGLRVSLGRAGRSWARENLAPEKVLTRIDSLYERCRGIK